MSFNFRHVHDFKSFDKIYIQNILWSLYTCIFCENNEYYKEGKKNSDFANKTNKEYQNIKEINRNDKHV